MATRISEGSSPWDCPSCKKVFEVRVVFFDRPRQVDRRKFAEEVRATMKRQGLKQADLAKLMGVTGAYISMLLSGNRGDLRRHRCACESGAGGGLSCRRRAPASFTTAISPR